MFKVGQRVFCRYDGMNHPAVVEEVINTMCKITFDSPITLNYGIGMNSATVHNSRLTKLSFPNSELEHGQVGEIVSDNYKGAWIARTFDRYIIVRGIRKPFADSFDLNFQCRVINIGWLTVKEDRNV